LSLFLKQTVKLNEGNSQSPRHEVMYEGSKHKNTLRKILNEVNQKK